MYYGEAGIQWYAGAKKGIVGLKSVDSGYNVSTVGKHGNETVIGKYAKEQGRETEYVKIHTDQLRLLWYPDASRLSDNNEQKL